MAYIPSKDADLLAWGLNYETLLVADPPRYGLTQPVADFVESQFLEYDAAYTLANDPATRTIVTVALKDEERQGFLSIARSTAAIIRSNQGVSDDDKAALGLTIPDPTPTPIPPPTTTPVLAAPLTGAAGVYLEMHDELTPNSKAKPFGVAGALLYRATGPALPLDFADAKVIQILTRADNIISNAGLTSGQQETFWAQWFNRKGELGPLGNEVSIVIV